MRDIYLHAVQTLSWLGPETASSSEGINYAATLAKRGLYHLASKGDIDLTPEQKEPLNVEIEIKVGHQGLEALFTLIDRPYFQRAWIVQEVAVSRNAYIVCGDNTLRWVELLLAVAYLVEREAWLMEFYPSQQMASLLCFRSSQEEWEQNTEVEWWRVLLRHRECQSTDGRDKVFAFLGLRCQSMFKQLNIEPDYDGSTMESLFTRLAVSALEKGHIEVLSVPRLVTKSTPGEDGDLKPLQIPSWAPDWRWSKATPPPAYWQIYPKTYVSDAPYQATPGSPFDVSFELNGLQKSDAGRTQKGELVGDVSGEKESRGEEAEQKERRAEEVEALPTRLRLRGYTVAKVTQLTPRRWERRDPPARQTVLNQARELQHVQEQIYEWESALWPKDPAAPYHPTADSGETELDAAYHTITAGIDTYNKAVVSNPGLDTRSAIAAFEKRQRRLRPIARIGLQHFVWVYVLVMLIEHVLMWFGHRNLDMDFRQTLVPIINRRGARLKDAKGVEYLGLLPGICEVGDEVFVCSGVKAPLVLRERRKLGGAKDTEETNQAQEEKEWEFIGDCYVHGMMTGEVWGKECQDVWIA